MFTEPGKLSQLQIVESLISNYEKSCSTFNFDCTSNFEKHYQTFNVVTGKGQHLTAGVREVFSGNTETQLNVLINIFEKLEEFRIQLKKSESDVSKKFSLQ